MIMEVLKLIIRSFSDQLEFPKDTMYNKTYTTE